MGNVFNRLRNLYGIALVKPKGASDKIPYPGKYNRDTDKIRPVKFSSELEQLYKFWLQETYDSTETLKNRIERYRDLDYMYYNNTIMSMSTELYADETVQADSQSQVIQVNGENRNVEKYIVEFFEKIGITQKILRSCAFDICLYGDCFWVNVTDGEEGIIKVVPVDVYSVIERFEYSAIEAQKLIKERERVYKNLIGKSSRLAKLTKMLQVEGNKDLSHYYLNYLFGYQMEDDIYLAPWNVSHFRRFSTKSEFYPYGRPLFINCIAPFRQLQASKNLMALARAKKFPIEHFEVETSDSMTEAEKWQRVDEARHEWFNLGINETAKEQFASGSSIWTPKGLLTFNIIENRMNLSDIDDIELLRDDLIMGTRIPKGYLIVDRASFGTSGQALLQQFKPFGRAVYTIQSAILEELVNLVKLQFVMTGDFDYNTDFEITMTFPVIEESQDRLRVKNDTLRLANDVVTNLQSALGLGRGEAIPPEVVTDIFGKLSFLTPEDVENWVNQISQNEEINETKKKAIMKKINGRLNENIVRETILKSKRRLKMEEGVLGNRHYMTSFKVDRHKEITLQLIAEEKDNKILKE